MRRDFPGCSTDQGRNTGQRNPGVFFGVLESRGGSLWLAAPLSGGSEATAAQPPPTAEGPAPAGAVRRPWQRGLRRALADMRLRDGDPQRQGSHPQEVVESAGVRV